jgi:hypothetical protein
MANFQEWQPWTISNRQTYLVLDEFPLYSNTGLIAIAGMSLIFRDICPLCEEENIGEVIGGAAEKLS